VLVNGRRVGLAGRVSMDMLTVDLGDVPAVIGDSCVLWGEGLPADEVAACAGTISYEPVLPGHRARPPRGLVSRCPAVSNCRNAKSATS